MERKNMLSKRIKCILIILLIMLTTINVPVFAVEDADATDPGQPTSSAYIEMKVKTVKVGETNQVLVECWASNFTKLESIDVGFSYDSTKLEPSNISSNDILENLASIKTWPTPTNPSTGLSIEEEEAFNNRSLGILKNSFAFSDNYKNRLELNNFRYLKDKTDNLQFVMDKTDDEEINISGEELIGTFSFVQKEGATIAEGVFHPVINIVTGNDGNDGAIVIDNTLEFTYQKYGSISGTIETGYYYKNVFKPVGKNIATIKVYDAKDVASIDWTLTKNDYKNARKNIQPIREDISLYKICGIPDTSKKPTIQPVKELIMDETNGGKFTVDTLPYGTYVVLIDKLHYADNVITNIVIDGSNPDMDLGKKTLIAGDIDKNGIIDKTDRTAFQRLYSKATDILTIFGITTPLDINDNYIMDKSDRTFLQRALTTAQENYGYSQTVKEVTVL